MDHIYTDKQKFKIAHEFDHTKDHCYLDNAGAALYSTTQMKNIHHDFRLNLYGNPHSQGGASSNCSEIIEQIRLRILRFFKVDERTHSIIFTSGATAAIKLLLESFTFNEFNHFKHDSDGTFYDAVEERGCFAYTLSNHTSVVGGREIAFEKGADVLCLPDETAQRLLDKRIQTPRDEASNCNSLFAYPAQCNFSGRKFPLEWAENVKNGALNNTLETKFRHSNWFTLLDAATYCSSSPLDLSKVKSDFVCLSFYKIFGYPTGLGALIVRNESCVVLKKNYFGGGTVDFASPSSRTHVLRKRLHERFEDGTLPYLSILALSHGFDNLKYLGLTMQQISLHVFELARYAAQKMMRMLHWNGSSLVKIYADTHFNNVDEQGGIVTFNLMRSDGSYIGYMEVLHISNSHKIQLRTGCFCNIGACQKHLEISDKQLENNFLEGHKCGDERDLVGGKPTGAVRVSFGYSTTRRQVDFLLQMLTDNFLEKEPRSRTLEDGVVLMERKFRLESIRVFPLKSCGAMEVNSWCITQKGLHLDRQWMVVTANGTCLTQKVQPLMCLIIPNVNLITEELTLTFNGLDKLEVKHNRGLAEGYSTCSNKVCGDRVMGEDCGDSVAAWLSHHLEIEGLRLVRQRSDDVRTNKIQMLRGNTMEPTGQLSLVNQAQYLLINRASVRWLRQRIQDEPDFNREYLEDRFRANFLIDGGKAFDELKWKSIRIGSLQFSVEGPCTRCQMICIDQKTGEKNRKPLVELSRAMHGKLRFGIYCSNFDLTGEPEVTVGDKIIVLETD